MMKPLVSLAFFLLLIQTRQLDASMIVNTSVTARCVNQISKKCIIQAIVIHDPADTVVLPDLSNKTSLQIKRGNITVFTENLSKNLGEVKKLHLGQLGLKELHLAPGLLEVAASSNAISVVKFTADAQYSTTHLKLNENQLTSLDGFEVLTRLEELRLQSNLLETLNMAVFSQMPALCKLDLGRNLITQITTTNPITLPHLDYLGLAGNRLTTLEVSSWNFESLLELDVSANDLIRIEGLQDQFGSLQQVAVSENSWHCGWLAAALENLQSNYVTIKDSDNDCEGLSPSNICCLHAEEDTKNTYEESFQKLKKLEEDHGKMQKEFEDKIARTQADLSRKLTDLATRVEQLQRVDEARSGLELVTELPFEEEFSILKKNLTTIQQTVREESKKYKEDTELNNQAQRQLQYKIMEMRIVVDRESQKVSEVQKQFDLLKDYVRGKLEKRAIHE